MWNTIANLLLAIGAAAEVEGISNDTVRKYIGIAAQLVQQGGTAREQIRELTEHVQQMVDEDRDPTEDEWAGLSERSDAAHRIIQDWTPGDTG